MSSSSAKTQAPPVDVVCNNLNLQQYVAHYSGNTKLLRLMLIAERCPNLRVNALTLLLAALKASSNVVVYRETMRIVDKMMAANKIDVARMNADFSADHEWLSDVERKLHQRSERLESELMIAKTTMVKESVRLAYIELWQLYCDQGSLVDAAKALLKSRDFSSSIKHTTEQNLRSAMTALDLDDYNAAQQHATKADLAEADPVTRNRAKVVLGLVAMHNGNLLSAAMRFLELDAETLADFSLVISHEDIALYGALCALATLGAADLRSGLREASKFRRFLEAAPSVRTLVNSFLDGRFFESIQWLESNRPLMLLDIHLSSCVDVVIGAIRDQIFVRYTTPYRTVCLSRMAAALGMDLPGVETTAASLIARGLIPARIDAHAKTLLRCEQATKQATVDKILSLARRQAKDARKAVLRLSVLQHGPLTDARNFKEQDGSKTRRDTRGDLDVGIAVARDDDEEEEAPDDMET